MVDYAKAHQAESGKKLLWGTANVFGNKLYMNGAATNPDFAAVALPELKLRTRSMLQSLWAERTMSSGEVAKVLLVF
jgi:xylose isomerase